MNKNFWRNYTVAFLIVFQVTFAVMLFSDGPEMPFHLKALLMTLGVMAVGFLLGDIKQQTRRDRDDGGA